jgi:hypothetical protein
LGPPRPTPCQRLAQQIVAHDDLRRRQAGDGRIGAAEHHVLARCLEIVVLDHVVSGSVPPRDRLRVLTDSLDVAHVAACDARLAGVERDAAFLSAIRVAVDVEPIERQPGRHHRE